MEEIVSKFGVVVCSRNGSDIDKFIYDSDLLTRYKVYTTAVSSLTPTIVIGPHYENFSARALEDFLSR